MADSSWPGEQLIVAAQRGDADSITALVSDAHPNVRRFARSLCATPEDAEDATQEALIILYRKIGMLRASGALASWMFRIVRNECLRRARTMRAHAPLPDAAVRSAEEVVLQRIEAGKVAAAIAALPAEQRRVLIMRDIQGYSGRTVAEALGLSTAAMKSRLHRARTAVQQSLRVPPEPAPGDTHDDNQSRRP
ncbi:RNA polymerase sigma factor [Streptomyces sp. CA-278952]|uniref:RNA polymerase sigma factor n=1 Tax=unclassified Streptomyces TaxID=2593676 RepID=UPI002242794E|nr:MULTISPECIES: RNA polymerase sigma factor [unclassified Streptomyces]UZI28780.1 RNA polymerase sigma factor [Streptomyces sp. VB1]WDG28729.1 RNA polymerase sigma factor [Streptomyces sp. CA-278952]WDG30335.1 RNA polymerase sigma factor [Streptomyces sp. CA-278952]